EQLCRNVAIIDHGQIIENTSVRHLLSQLDVETFVLDLKEPIEKAPEIEAFDVKFRDECCLEVMVPKAKALNSLFMALENQGIRVQSMRNKANRLEELFMRLVEEQVQDQAEEATDDV
ncbi:MAG: ABC transporter ATP-binding protein, partial [Xanthomonadales bacterium]|nr:ABC transporter ATP-binding protein [Xanthomonadales bacterium]